MNRKDWTVSRTGRAVIWNGFGGKNPASGGLAPFVWIESPTSTHTGFLMKFDKLEQPQVRRECLGSCSERFRVELGRYTNGSE